jgi:hypothetical protein
MRKSAAMIQQSLIYLAVAATVFGQSSEKKAEGNDSLLVTSIVHCKALEGNPLGESPDQPVIVLLPPSYFNEPNRRYPVVYLLHGFSMKPDSWIKVSPKISGCV